MNSFIKLGIIFVGFIFTAGCSFMSPVKIGPDTGYVINAMPHHVAKARSNGATLLVMHPETAPAYNTTRIAYTLRPYQLSYYAQNRWISVPADMLEPLLVKTMHNTRHFKTIISPPFTGQYQYALRTQIQTLEADYTSRRPLMQLNVLAQIIRASTGSVLATREFNISIPLQQYSPYGEVVAANHATSQLLAKLSAWCVRHTH